jgi:uncharacterized delta-60 repeat protein
MTCNKSISPQRNSPCLNFFVKKRRGILTLSVFLLFVAFFSINRANAQSGERLSSEKEESQSNSLRMSGDIDSSFVANLLTTVNQQGSRALVSTITRQNDGRILVSGNFSYVSGVPRASFVRLNRDGSVDAKFNPAITSSIQKILPLADGKILIGGFFSVTFNNLNYSGLARLNEDGSLDEGFAVNTSGVSDFAVQPDGKIVVGGSFTQINGFSINRIARLNTDGSLDTSFQIGNGADSSVFAVAIQPDGKIVIGGAFSTFNNAAKPRLARLNADGSLDEGFNAGTGANNTSGPSNTVTQIIIQSNNKILIGGIFNAVNGVARSAGIARLEANGTLDTTFAPVNPLSNTSGVRLALQADGKILAGFGVNSTVPATTSTLYRFNSADGTLDTTFTSIVNAGVSAILPEDDGKIIIGGAFSQVNGVFKNALARLNPGGATDNSFNYILAFPGSARIAAIQADGKILVAGNFEYVNETPRSNFARFNADGSLDESFNVTVSFANNGFTSILTVVPQLDGKIVIGGNFTTVNGQTVNRITRLRADGSIDPDFNIASTAGPNGTVTAVVNLPDGKIFVIGSFTAFSGSARPGLVRLNQNGSVDITFDAPFTSGGNTITATMLQSDGKLLLAGTFTQTNGTQRRGVIRLNSNGSIDEGFNMVTDGLIYSIVAQPDGKILIGGSFITINGVSRRNIARLNADGVVDATFSPRSGASSQVNAIVLQADGKIIIGGDFSTVNGIRRTRLARLNSNGSLDDFNIDFFINPGFFSNVTTLVMQSGGRLLIGGNFTQIGGLSRVGLARLRLPAYGFAPLFDFDGDGKTDFAVFRPNSGAWYKLNSSNGIFDGRLFGLSTDRIVPGDYDGDGKTDIAVFRPSSGEWIILKSTTNEVSFQQFGANGDRPLAADYDGDGRDDLAVFRPSNGTWYILGSTGGFQAVQFGVSTDVPLIGDFDGDGKSDVAVFRPSNGNWYVLPSLGGFTAVQFGVSEDIPVAADYDGDGKTDFAVFRPSNATWYSLRSTQGFTATQFGSGTDRPVPGDYDGDGKADLAVFRPSTGTWLVTLSSNNSVKSQVFGLSGDLPIPAAYLR